MTGAESTSQVAERPVAPSASRLSRVGYQIYRTALGVWKFIVGVVCTQSFVFSFVALGWVTRAAQRPIQLAWCKRSAPAAGTCFCDFVQCSSFHQTLGGWPNWILEGNRAWLRAHRQPGFGRKARAYAKAFVHSFWLNLKIGAQMAFNTWVFTMPGCVLMLFSWYAGWHNSFNKGYEQALVGPLTGFGGIALFIAAMYYVPMAQMRQTATGNWRAFYQFRLVWTLVRKRWLSCLGLALLFTAASVPVTILKTVPAFFPQINPRLAELSPAEALEFAKAYYFYTAFVFFGAFLFLRLMAARVYASALLACVQSGAITEDVLAENEWETLQRLDFLRLHPAPPRHVLVRTLAWLGTRVGRAVTGVALFLVWFSFIAQVYISEFFLRSPGAHGWLNQPLVQLPLFNYIPEGLKTPPDQE